LVRWNRKILFIAVGIFLKFMLISFYFESNLLFAFSLRYTMEDSYRYKGLRKLLMDELRSKNIASEQVLQAMLEVPRHFFFPDQVFWEKAYENIAFQIGEGQTISHPSTVAAQSTLLEVKKGDKVLEIGTGSGYQTAVLLKLGAKVFSIERQHALFVRTKALLEKLKLNARVSFGDGYQGWPIHAPFNKIIVTAGAPFVPQPLVDQLAPEGILVIPVGNDNKHVMHVIRKDSHGNIEEETKGDFRFVPLLEKRN
jgi:protein-L-isoaspartate(D-aspartate) O-methyltransferase